jgi:hypothetical protein
VKICHIYEKPAGGLLLFAWYNYFVPKGLGLLNMDLGSNLSIPNLYKYSSIIDMEFFTHSPQLGLSQHKKVRYLEKISLNKSVPSYKFIYITKMFIIRKYGIGVNYLNYWY